MTLALYNTLTRKKEPFVPIDSTNVRMYVCGPTVYDRPHLGNARSVVIYDVLYRLLKQLYGDTHVTYIRNITDVDDKINAAALASHEPISALTRRVESWFHEDIGALNILPATCVLNGKNNDSVDGCMGEPHATDHIADMIGLIEKLITREHAYIAHGHVLFRVQSYEDYGQLSGRKLDDLIAGSRIEVGSYKEYPGDFVLWKPANDRDDASSVFDSPWGKGRPGWHIECSAMATRYLGEHFDIHGGGADLMFPHHENEIAQSRCALPGSAFANVWVHNGFLTVNGEKMSKSLGNFTTVKDMLDKGVQGEVIRFALLMSKYNEPLDWNEKLLRDAKITLDKFYKLTDKPVEPCKIPAMFLDALLDDLNMPKAIAAIHGVEKGNEAVAALKFLGFLAQPYDTWFKKALPPNAMEESWILSQIGERIMAKQTKNWAEADRIRKNLSDKGILLEDRPTGETHWRYA